jgi:hypothetical protein
MLARAAGEHDEGRTRRNDIEEAVGREIDHAGWVERRDPTDRTRHHETGAGIMGETMRLAARIVVHENVTPFNRWTLPLRPGALDIDGSGW